MRQWMIYFKKEWLEAVRTKKVLAIGAMALFFALLDPVILRLTPMLLKEFSGLDLGDAIQLSQTAELISFQQDIFQIFTLVLVMVVGSTWVNEIKKQTIVIPLSKGASYEKMIIVKIIVYSLITGTIMIMAFILNYIYSGMIFEYRVSIIQALYSGLLMGYFYTFAIALVIGFSIWFGHYLVAAFGSLLILYVGLPIVNLLDIRVYTPYEILQEASLFPRLLKDEIGVSLVCTLMIIAVIIGMSVVVAKKKALIRYR